MKSQSSTHDESGWNSFPVGATESVELYLPFDERQFILATLERFNKITGGADPDDFLQQMVTLMIDVVGGQAGILYLLDADAGELVIAQINGSDRAHKMTGLRIRQDQGIVGAAMIKNEAIVVKDLSSDPRWLHAMDPDFSERWKNAITLPLANAEKVVGVLQIYNYSRKDLDFLNVLAARMTSEIDRMVMIEKTTRTNRRLNSLIDVIGKVAGTLDRDQLLRLSTEYAADLVDVEKTSIFLVDPESDEVTQHISYQAQSAPQDSDTFSIRELLRRGWSPGSPKPMNSTDGRSQAVKNHSFAGYMAQSALTIPLQSGLIQLGRRVAPRDGIMGGLMALNRNKNAFSNEEAQLLGILANQTSTNLQIAELYADANELFLDVIKALVTSIDAKDPYTQGHSVQVSEISVAIGKEMGLPQQFMDDLQIGSLLHDIGKIGIPDRILLKPGRLTNKEFEIIKQHPSIGANIMRQVRMLWNSMPAIEQHHERLDGSGYPKGLGGDKIQLMGRIVGVADVFDAMTTDRPYRRALATSEVLEYMTSKVSVLFDPECVQALIRFLESNPGYRP